MKNKYIKKNIRVQIVSNLKNYIHFVRIVDLYLYFIVGIISGNVAGRACCEDGWMAFQGSCYFFGHTTVSFIEAEVSMVYNVVFNLNDRL